MSLGPFTFENNGGTLLNTTSSGRATTGTCTLLTAGDGFTIANLPSVNLPVGWSSSAPYIDGNDLKIGITIPTGSAYDAWVTGSEPFDGDANGDGVKDGLAFLLGAVTVDTDATSLLSAVTEDGSGGLVLTFNCLPTASRGPATLKVEHSSDLATWTAALVPGVAGITDVGSVHFEASGTDPISVTASIPISEAAGGISLCLGAATPCAAGRVTGLHRSRPGLRLVQALGRPHPLGLPTGRATRYPLGEQYSPWQGRPHAEPHLGRVRQWRNDRAGETR